MAFIWIRDGYLECKCHHSFRLHQEEEGSVAHDFRLVAYEFIIPRGLMVNGGSNRTEFSSPKKGMTRI